MARTRPSAQEGFTLVEVLVAALVLVVGALTAFRLVDAANATTSVNSARIGATNLERELIEYARGSDYDQLQPLTLESTLRQRASVAGSGSPWRITRRGVTYTVTPSVCTFDDPKDGLAAAGSAPDNPCPAAAADPSATNADGTAKVDQNPDDFRRVTIKLDWRVRARSGTMTQSGLIVNPAGGLGPRIIKFDEPVGDITTSSIAWGGVRQLTSTAAAGVHWTTSDGKSQGDAAGGPTAWNFTWDLGPDKSDTLNVDGTWVLDGNYTVQAQAVDSRGTPGEARVVTVHINRHGPGPVQNVDGGYDTRFSSGIVDLHWSRYPETDVRGYKVYRDGSTLVCPSDGSPWVDVNTPRCTDTDPGALGTIHTYTVKAVDCRDLTDLTLCDRESATATPKLVTLLPGVSLGVPSNLTVSIVDGLPRLDWTGVTGASFYRIYRDTGTRLQDRYDETITSSPTYTDPSPGSGGHTYWVTAVGPTFDESAPSSPVTAP